MLCYYCHSLHSTPRPLGDGVKPGRGTNRRETCAVLTSNRLPFRGQLSASLRSMNWSFSVFAAERNLEMCHNSLHGRGFWDVRQSLFLGVPADCRLRSRSTFDWREPEMCKNSINSRKYKAHGRLRGWPWSLLPECKQIKTVEKLHLSTYENVYSRRSPTSFVNSVIFLYAKTTPAN